MTVPARTVFTVDDLLSWAWDETQLADALQECAADMEQPMVDRLSLEIAKHRSRSRWLDEQVAWKLEQVDAGAGGQ